MINRALALHKTVAEIAAHVGGKVIGDASLMIESVAPLTEAGPSDLSFLASEKYAAAAMVSKAGCLLLPLVAEKAPGACQNRILVEDPLYAFSQVLHMVLAQRPKPTAGADPKAVVHPSAKLGAGASVGALSVVERDAVIGDNTVIGAQVFIGEGVKIGSDCTIYPQVVIREGCVLGDRVILQPGVVIGGDGYGFAPDRKTGKHRKVPQLGNVILEDDVEIQANTTIDRGTLGPTIIGDGTKIDNLAQIAHNVKLGPNCLIVAQAGIAGSAVLGTNVTIGGQVGVAGHTKVGDRTMVAAQSGIMSDLEPGKVWCGTPVRTHRDFFRITALTGRLPELYESVKQIKKQLGIKDAPEA